MAFQPLYRPCFETTIQSCNSSPLYLAVLHPAASHRSARISGGMQPQKRDLHIQFNGKSYASEELIKIAKDVWVFDLNQEEKDFKSVELYVKPEENVVYYVINGSVQGSFNI